MKTARCNCWNHEACERRVARGLEPWCGDASKISVTNRAANDAKDGIFTSYEAAVEASPVRKARWISGGGTTGSPARFQALQG